MADEISRPTDPDVQRLTQDFKTLTPEQALAKAKEHLDNLEKITINMAVTGEAGSGKSTFINAWRGLRNDDEGAAKTGVVETTMEPTRYTHPTMTNVYIWDLPGIGTSKFSAKDYLKNVRFETFDFFILLSAGRFRENDVSLAKEIKRMKKLFYFVRTKTDADVAAEGKNRDFNEEDMLTKIREDCKKNLTELGDPKIFLISSFDLGKYDFQKLVEALEEDLSPDMGSTLIQSLPVCSLEMIEKKKKSLRRVIWLLCFSSAGVAMVPIPGLSVGVDIAIVISFLTKCYITFGLSERSLGQLSTKSGVPVSELKAKMKSIFSDGITTELVTRFAVSWGVATAMTLEYFFSLIPAVGSLAAGGLSFATTYMLLKRGLDEMVAAAKRVLQAAGLK